MKLKPKTLAQAFWEMIRNQEYEPITHTLTGLQSFFNLYDLECSARDFFNHPKIPAQEKIKVIGEFVDLAKISPEAENFLILLLNKQQLHELSTILAHLYKLKNDHFLVASVQVFSAEPLTEKQKKDLEETLKKVTKATHIELSEITDEALLGGMIIRADNEVWDASLRSKLKKVKKSLQT